MAAAFLSKISVSKEVSYKAATAQVLALYLCCKFTIIPPDMSIRAARFETLFGEVLRVLQQFSRSHRNANMHNNDILALPNFLLLSVPENFLP